VRGCGSYVVESHAGHRAEIYGKGDLSFVGTFVGVGGWYEVAGYDGGDAGLGSVADVAFGEVVGSAEC